MGLLYHIEHYNTIKGLHAIHLCHNLWGRAPPQSIEVWQTFDEGLHLDLFVQWLVSLSWKRPVGDRVKRPLIREIEALWSLQARSMATYGFSVCFWNFCVSQG